MTITDNPSVAEKSSRRAEWRAVVAAGYFATSTSLFAASAFAYPYGPLLFGVGIVFAAIGTVLVIRIYQNRAAGAERACCGKRF